MLQNNTTGRVARVVPVCGFSAYAKCISMSLPGLAVSIVHHAQFLEVGHECIAYAPIGLRNVHTWYMLNNNFVELGPRKPEVFVYNSFHVKTS
eukprot:IDg13280t1